MTSVSAGPAFEFRLRPECNSMVLQLLPGIQGSLEVNRLADRTQRRIHRVREQMHRQRLALAGDAPARDRCSQPDPCAHSEIHFASTAPFWNFEGSLREAASASAPAAKFSTSAAILPPLPSTALAGTRNRWSAFTPVSVNSDSTA